jgi:hypothetical protein
MRKVGEAQASADSDHARMLDGVQGLSAVGIAASPGPRRSCWPCTYTIRRQTALN